MPLRPDRHPNAIARDLLRAARSHPGSAPLLVRCGAGELLLGARVDPNPRLLAALADAVHGPS